MLDYAGQIKNRKNCLFCFKKKWCKLAGKKNWGRDWCLLLKDEKMQFSSVKYMSPNVNPHQN